MANALDQLQKLVIGNDPAKETKSNPPMDRENSLLFGWSMKAVAEMGAQGQRDLRVEHFKDVRYAVQNKAIADEIALGKELLGRTSLAGELPRAAGNPSIRRGRPFVRKPTRDAGPEPRK